jgi:limonene-1,2-epoxide hydrolase
LAPAVGGVTAGLINLSSTNIEIIRRHIAALNGGELAALPIAETISFDNPVSGAQKGADSYRAFLSGFLAAIENTRVHRFVSDGEYVVADWEVDSVFGIIPILEIFRIEDDLIVESRAFFDPRPVLGG